MATIALVDGDEQSRLRMERLLRTDGFDVLTAEDGLQGLRIAFDARPEAAVVDLDAQHVGGLELIRILRAACDVPIVALLGDHHSEDVVRALEAGADDVVSKSTGATELLARLRAAVRRYERRATSPVNADRQMVRTGGIEIDRDAQTVRKFGTQVQLSRTEYRLMEALGARLGETAPHRYLLSTVWGDEYLNDTHYLRVYVGYLRAKFEDEPGRPQYILNDWGVGYRLARLPHAEAPAAALSVGTVDETARVALG